MTPLIALLVFVLAAVTLLAGVRARRTDRASVDWSSDSEVGLVLARQRQLGERLPTTKASVMVLPVGPGADGARAAYHLMARSEAA